MKVKTLVLAGLTLWTITSQADEAFPVIKANGQVYSNVTVVKVTDTDIFFVSDQGVCNVKLDALDPALQKHFNHEPTNSVPSAPISEKFAAAKSAVINTQFSRFEAPKTFQAERQQILAIAHSKEALVIAGILFCVYLFFCYCFKRICENCGVAPGMLIWVPIFNLIRLLQAGGLSGWFFLLFFLPIVNVVLHIVMWVKVCQACGKSAWLVLLLFVPIINIFFIPYLAFSGTNKEAASAKLPPQGKSGTIVLR